MNTMFPAVGEVDVSVVIPVIDRTDDAETVWRAYQAALMGTDKSFEFIYVLDGPHTAYAEALERISERDFPLNIVRFNRSFGQVACLLEGVRHARGNTLLFLPAYLQVAPEALPQLLDRIETADVAAAFRDRSTDNVLSRMRGWSFEAFARMAGSRFKDPGCVARAVKKHVFAELQLHHEQHPFLPMLAERLGFSVEQVCLPQAQTDRRLRTHRPITYMGIALDLVVLGFITRFMRKPFRFFGSLGAAFIAIGVALGIYLLIQRQTLDMQMSDRPALLLTVLLIVLGIQIGAVGLIAEIIIFTRNPSHAAYRIEKIVAQPDEDG
ncbi:glycosyl transferase [Novosphingobium endophyticum]|uniref:Glycosyl transferase n=1 Tax=Novosphingobium endophyticum TaxID=1955250 RepID=A0A916X6Y7_9SPHN|nr:glycosyltransferase [Novosphingobium endophyticum]GGC09978.1 glycosyl transferase [Novosphingobium endophyticum]